MIPFGVIFSFSDPAFEDCTCNRGTCAGGVLSPSWVLFLIQLKSLYRQRRGREPGLKRRRILRDLGRNVSEIKLETPFNENTKS